VLRVASYLVFTVGPRTCALPTRHVTETLRPVPVRPAADAPPFVTGIGMLRGSPAPIVDAGILLGEGPITATRLLSLRTDDGRAIGLLATEVLGVRAAATIVDAGLPPLLDGQQGPVATLARLDQQLLTVLSAGRLLS
jgi:purine-binding chemotaxis protein CheW